MFKNEDDVRAKMLVSELAKLKFEAVRLKEITDDVKLRLMSFMEAAGLMKVLDDAGNKVTYINAGTSSKFDKDKAKQLLVAKGVRPDIIGRCFDASTEKGVKEAYIKLTKKKQLC